ncbi:DUF4389 domain-containing protein [Pseudomonas massiliensis]|uniref:DUF4389 domain-containing protein n=1 Tax=Pseudomonas massiliensis TaxID=522492 RepID=UPI00058DF39C|nr:DUF4389 domain-containing protein [Pseudomonas massiliensis]
MSAPRFQPEQESIALRVVWMLLFLLVWQGAQLLLAAVVLLQLLCRLLNGVPHEGLMTFGDSLGRYLAQIARFGSFHSEQKPWPFADWPAARPGDFPPVVTTPAAPAPAPSSAQGEEPPL